MDNRALMVATVPSMIGQFNMSNIHILQELGYEVDIASDFTDTSVWPHERVIKLRDDLTKLSVSCFQVNFSRDPVKLYRHFEAYREVTRLIENRKYSIIHTHTPIAAAIVRIAAQKTKTKVLYTAHGFHFFKGGPVKNWLLYYPIEKLCSCWTEVLITINSEDYALARTHFHSKRTEYIHGVGIDTRKFLECTTDRNEMRSHLGILEEDFLVFSVGELNHNKNHETVIRAIAALKNQRIKYYICGLGALEEYLLKLVRSLGLESQVHLLGYRQDIPSLLRAADLFAFPSRREGLGLSAIEAMAAGLPLLTSNVQGIRDYAVDGEGAFVCPPNSVCAFADALRKAYSNRDLLRKMGEHNKKECLKYDQSVTDAEMRRIYGFMRIIKNVN